MEDTVQRDALVLAWLNDVRANRKIGPALAQLPPNASLDSKSVSTDCPVAVALAQPCGTGEITFRDDVRIEFPPFVCQFILDHDRAWLRLRGRLTH